ncbi:Inositol polyphosphate kinase family protein [Tritrichomonas foetus]|uniref:Kinase n=1 Tax=Tritrichomonas foetus TaxID=1144522 RepID=A0A1J4K9E6_9EUKA|nr:Inositol polyphosphate kinase family protein [Tritrichomonas foetus]|eukprot:OHT06069.1 Inositol polyphosphate kinase family protein [Tritrichomonas foetus]
MDIFNIQSSELFELRLLLIMILRFLEDVNDKNHRPHDVFRCVIAPFEREVIAKINSRHEGETIRSLHYTKLSPHLPEFYGIYQKYILMEDLTQGYSSPCRFDFKIGTRTWDINASDKFKNKLRKKNLKSSSQLYGVRLVSCEMMKKNETIENSTKSENLSLSYSQIYEKIQKYVDPQLRNLIAEKLNSLSLAYSEVLKEHPNMRVYSGSVLVCFDGDDPKLTPKVKFIDFAHFHFDITKEGFDPNDHSLDDNVLYGIKHLINLFK